MAIKNKDRPQSINTGVILSCDMCGSENIIETNEGYTCQDCGIVLEMQRLKYHFPYDENKLQIAPLRNTQIGFKRERMRSPQGLYFNRLNKLNSLKENEERSFEEAKKEINRIIEALKLKFSLKAKKILFENTIRIRNKLEKGTKFRNMEKLVPITLYVYCKTHGFSINYKELLEVSKITKNEFLSFLKQIQHYIPQYSSRNRQEYIAQKILEITEQFHMEMDFYYQSKAIMNKLWEMVKNTKDDVVAGVACSISALCCYNDRIKVKNICDKLHIRMSTIQSQIKTNIFDRLNISGFTSLIRSANLLKKVMQKMGILSPTEEENEDSPSIQEKENVIQIKFKKIEDIFNSNNSDELHYLNLSNDNDDEPVFLIIKKNKRLSDMKPIGSVLIMDVYISHIYMEDNLDTGKGPPCI